MEIPDERVRRSSSSRSPDSSVSSGGILCPSARASPRVATVAESPHPGPAPSARFQPRDVVAQKAQDRAHTGAGRPGAPDPLAPGNVLASIADLPGSSITLLESDTSTVRAAVSRPWRSHTRVSRTSPARAPGAGFRGPPPGPSSSRTDGAFAASSWGDPDACSQIGS
jgi:hypothetical protein